VHEHIAAAVIRLDETKAFLAIEPFNCTCRHILFSEAHMRNSRERSRDSNSIPKMSLKEEPAGAFNKAQRLIELRQHRQLPRIMQGANDQNA
jgi:hypothetical protein